MKDEELLLHLQQCITSGEQYRDKFKATWEETEKQIRCDPPDEWDTKENWQTKIYIPLQAKKEETAVSYLNKMVFGKRRNFEIRGVEKEDEDSAHWLTVLIDNLLEIGNFRKENNFILSEATGSPGTAFCKILLNTEGFLKFIWRSPYNAIFDPECGHDFYKTRWWIDCYKKDIAYIVSQTRENGLYASEKGVVEVKRFLADAQGEVEEITKKAGQGSTGAPASMMIVKGIDGTTDITIPQNYKTVDVHECWMKIPNEKGIYEDRIITLLNQKYILRNDENIYGCIPVTGCRTKPRKYDYYGRGYLENCRGFQDLSNSLVNLGFDSAKISAMDIIVIDDAKVKDSSTIKYKPLAIWKMKDINGVKIQRQPMSAITDIIRGLTLIDQLDQEASGITRQAQGVPSLSGAGTESETLGEYQLKLAAIDQRFLDVGRFIETDYFIPLIKIIFKIITNPKLFNQDKANRLLGFKEIDDLQTVQETDPNTGEVTQVVKNVGKKKIIKLDLEKIRQRGEMAYDFKATGITMMTERLETLQKLKEGLLAALQNPTLTAMTKIDLLWKKIWQVSEIDDYDEFLRSKEEIKELLGQQQQTGGAGSMPPQMQGGI